MDRKQTKKKFEFDPKSNYSWEPEDVFSLTGLEIDKINKALAAASSTPEFQRNAVLYEGLLAFNNFFRSAVEEGSIRRQPDEEKEEVKFTPPESEPEDAVVVGEQTEEAVK